MMEIQQQQMKLLQDGLLIAKQTATIALNKAATPQESRTGNVFDFRRLHPVVFTGTGKPLKAKQWLINTTNLLNAARIHAED